MTSPPLRYGVDARDRIRFVGEGWLEVARRGGAEALAPDSVVGRSIWEFVSGGETRHLYGLLFEATRLRGRVRRLPFRCDEPERRVEMELSIVPAPGGALELESAVRRVEPRERVELLDPEAPRSDALVTVCSWCKRIRVAEREWCEVEGAVRRLALFDSPLLPGLTHGLCEGCDAALARELDA